MMNGVPTSVEVRAGLSTGAGAMPSLMEGVEAGATAPTRARRRWFAGVRARWAEVKAHPARHALARKRIRVGGVVLLAVLGVGAYFALRPVPQPDYLNDSLDDVLDYTLLTDEFNRLPVKKRVELIGDLVKRLKSMSAGDSALMAAFAAGVAGSARAQIEENVSRLVLDAWDEKAKDYPAVPPEQRVAYLESTFLEFEKMMEALGGEVRERSDEERLANVRRQTKRDIEAMNDPEKRPDSESLARFVTFMDSRMGSRATPAQRSRGQQMLRDMSRHFRGQDVETGRARGGG